MTRIRRSIGQTFLILCCLLLGSGALWAQGPSHLAIMIGNDRYAHLPDLPNVTRDLPALSKSLRARGYRTVELRNLDRRNLLTALARLRLVAQDASQVIVYFGGHGAEVAGNMHLFTPEARPEAEVWRAGTIPLELILRAFSDQPRQKLVLIDACRDNPLYDLDLPTTRPAILPGGTLLAYAAQPGSAAYDGVGGHSPFAAALISSLLGSETDLYDILRHVRLTVVTETGGQQIPWTRSSLFRRAELLSGLQN